MNAIFAEIGTVILVATAFALLARFFKQPPLVGYILTGVTLGPLGARLLGHGDLFEGMRQIGTALLLFLVGLELDWRKAKHQIQAVSYLGFAQITVSFGLGFGLALLTGQSVWTGVYLGLALSFSSTVIVVKLLSESRELSSLHGRLAIGTLILQDLVAVVALTLIGGIAQPSSIGLIQILFLLTLKVASLLALVWFLTLYVLPPLFVRIARSSELLFLGSIAWCFAFAMTITRFDLPLEIGAFLAGLSLASLPYSLDMVGRLRSLRDYFVILLFIAIGSELVLPTGSTLTLTIYLALLTVFAKPLFATVTLVLRGYRSRTSFLTGFTQGQMSEFSLILATVGLSHGHLSPDVVSSLTVASVVSILISTIFYGQRANLYRLLRPWLHRTERSHFLHENLSEEPYHDHIVIYGYHRMGYHILKQLRSLRHRVVVVDFNPDIIKRLKEQQVECVYGDVQDEEILELVQVKTASMVISTIPHRDETRFLVESIRKRNRDGILIVTAHHIDDALQYYRDGANYVILPHLLGGEHIADLISKYERHELRTFMHHRAEEVKLLKTRNHALYYD